MYTVQETASMQQQAKLLKLKYPQEFVAMPPELLAKMINGYGPEHWSERLRKIITWIFRHYPLPAAIHDFRYEFSDGIEPTRKAADAEFAVNLRLIWQNRYGKLRFFNIFAWFDYWKIRTASKLVKRFSRSSWQNSYHRRKEANYE